ncbi:hypothetical protein SAMN04487783_1353 [Agrococcus baldri]|uniref:Uncharacterized protein n=1 Tax=Agrococcus baldri TaxID=153730 RepID=A0AA94KZG6_9MICO|nr:hypothetical protein [Agrococcus baldri]SFS10069.1 hypothetical protein SAMN04487783_1353 [Agrococcus baldri]
MFDLEVLLVAVGSVLGVGLLLGAGIPLIYALGVRSRESGRPGSNAVSAALMLVCVLLALGGIVVIVFGDAIFGG